VSSPAQVLAGLAVVRARTAAGLGGICLSLAAASAAATDYEFNPWVELGGGYDDNVLLAAPGPDKVGEADAMADARVRLLAQESNWQLLAMPEARGIWYPSQSEFDANAEFLTLIGQRSGPRYTLSLGAYGSSQSLLTGFLPTTAVGTGLGQSEPGTTLAAPADIRQNLGSLSPSYTLQMTPRSSLQLNADYTDSTYNRSLPAYVGYENATGSAGLAFAASPINSLTLRATGADFRPDSGRTADTYGAEAQWDGKYSEIKQYYLRVGIEHTDFSGVVAGAPLVSGATLASGTTNWSAGAGTHWTYSLTEIFVDATRNVAPTPQGYAVNLDQLRLRVAQRLTPRFAAFLGARAMYESPLNGAIAAGQIVRAQHYNYATTGFEWRLQREFSVIAEYSLTEYHYIQPPGQANSIQLSFVYEPHRPAEGAAITVEY
jgi:hypothetical protein